MMKILLFLIVITLFIIPFFWFKPGEVNLGGDSSRLYFYDPISYVKTLIYNVSPGQTGGEWITYFMIPFVLLLALLKSIVQYPSLVINLFHSFMLITSFLFTYLTIVELFRFQKKKNEVLVQIVGILGALFYSCMSILGNNWDKALVTHNEIFLNPLNFYLLLRYVHTNNHLYPLIIILVTFLFAPNFSWIGTPAVVAFYSFSVLYLLLYKKFIVKTPFLWKNIVLLIALCLLVHSFHLIPQAFYILVNERSASGGIFSSGFAGGAVSYFVSVAGTIKLTSNLIDISSSRDAFFHFFLFLFPFILIAGLFFHARFIHIKKDFVDKNYLLLVGIFLVILFFTTANITHIGFSFYKSLFGIPGFAMFKNFQGKFLYVYMFFYALVFSYSFYYVFISLKKKTKILLICVFVPLILIGSTPFLRGGLVNLPVYQANKNVKVPFKMDPEFEKALEYIRKQPTDGKYLTVPLTDHGYQMLSGTEGGLYIGPSMLAFLTGKKDFSGYDGFGGFKELLLQNIKDKDYDSIKNLFSIVNIQYIFYNSDPYIYEANFPQFPYLTMNQFFPTTASVKTFIESLNAKQIATFGNKYHIYELEKTNMLPQLYVASQSVSTDKIEFPLSRYNFSKDRIVVGSNNPQNTKDIIPIDKVDIYRRITPDVPMSIYYPFAKWELNHPLYFLLPFKERYLMNKRKQLDDTYIDQLLLMCKKRVSEIFKWENTLKIVGTVHDRQQLLDYWKEPAIGNVNKDHATWESALSRYADHVNEATEAIRNSQNRLNWKMERKSQLKKLLADNRFVLEDTIRKSNRTSDEKEYLEKLLSEIFSYYTENENTVTEYDPSILEYIGPYEKGEYNLYFHTDQKTTPSFLSSPISTSTAALDSWVFYDKVSLKGDDLITIKLKEENIGDSAPWTTTTNIETTNEADVTSLESSLSSHGEFIKSLKNFEEKSHYLVSFDYNTYGNQYFFNLLLKDKNKGNIKKDPYFYSSFIAIKNTTNWQRFHAIFYSTNVEEGIFTMRPDDIKIGPTRISVKNFLVTKLPSHYDAILEKVGTPTIRNNNIPKISFTKINPTKYRIDVQGASSPYTLVFSENYSNNWKLHLLDESPKISPAEKIISMFVKDQSENKPKISEYFNGEIKETVSNSTFIDTYTIKTWGKQPIADNNHFIANGYANGWNIMPSDTGNKTKYTIIMELSSQRNFYYGIFFSLIGIIIWLIAVIKLIGKRKTKNK